MNVSSYFSLTIGRVDHGTGQWPSPGFQYTRLPHYLIMALYLRQNSSSHFNNQVRNVADEFRSQHSSLQSIIHVYD